VWYSLNVIQTNVHHEYGIGAVVSEFRPTAPMPWGRIAFMMNTRRDRVLLTLQPRADEGTARGGPGQDRPGAKGTPNPPRKHRRRYHALLLLLLFSSLLLSSLQWSDTQSV